MSTPTTTACGSTNVVAVTLCVCAQCDRKFAFESELKRHARKHIDNKEFKCPVCDREFTEQSIFNTHLKGKHGYVEIGWPINGAAPRRVRPKLETPTEQSNTSASKKKRKRKSVFDSDSDAEGREADGADSDPDYVPFGRS